MPQSKLKNKYDFSSAMLEIIIGGKSFLDSPSAFRFADFTESDLFIFNYGYDLENPIERAELLGNFHEASNFVRRYFLHPENLDGLSLEIPRKILELTDIRELLLMVSALEEPLASEKRSLASWACALLKVMHAISHIDKDLRTPYFGDIQKQIFDRFYRFIHRDSEGHLFLGEKEGDPLRVDLFAFETKPKKSRDSIILKLLHKPESVAEDIFDRVGIRFITQTPIDALRVVKYLKDKMIILPANIKPSRSRNTLIEINNLKPYLSELLDQNLTEDEFLKRLQPHIRPPVCSPDNPYSSKFYHSIQFTCRQLIKMRNSTYDSLRELKTLSRSEALSDHFARILDRVDLKLFQREVRFFYPYEIQVVDKKNSDENEKGKSAHSEYKRAQILSAMKRVMKPLMNEIAQ